MLRFSWDINRWTAEAAYGIQGTAEEDAGRPGAGDRESSITGNDIFLFCFFDVIIKVIPHKFVH